MRTGTSVSVSRSRLFRTACMAAVFPKIMSRGGRLRDAADSALWTKVIFSYRRKQNRKGCNALLQARRSPIAAMKRKNQEIFCIFKEKCTLWDTPHIVWELRFYVEN